MRKEKGFTLIELLAVIVILAVIALITIPQVLNILAKSRLGAAEDSANGIINAAENYVANFMLQNNGDIPNENFIFNCSQELGCQLQNNLEEYNTTNLNVLSFKGTKPTSGTVVIKNNGKNIIANDLKINGFTCNYINQEIVCDELNRYKEEILHGADPVLSGNLIGVTIDSDGIVKKADLEKEWYNYENKEWANAVVTKSNTNYEIGAEIPEADIKQYYVWIPRYRYELWNVNSVSAYPKGDGPSPINIEFESVATEASNDDWLTHPAFTSFETNGIWVGKFETSYDEETYTDNSLFLQKNPNSSKAKYGEKIIIKPNVRSLINKKVSEFYTLSLEVNKNLNSHMMKNSEWGAVAYLTYSQYGKCTKTSCEEVYINNVNTGNANLENKFTGQWGISATITGCSGNSVSASVNSNKDACETGYSYINAYASTTGNISGIYDMSGGNWEYVMGVLSDINGNPMSGRNNAYNSGFNGTYGCPKCDNNTLNTITELTTGIEYPIDKRYYDLYKTNYELGSDIGKDYTTGKLGDATKEIAVTGNSNDIGLWFSDLAQFATPAYPWFCRGGSFHYGSGAGVLNFARYDGRASTNHSFRVVLAY